MHLAEMFGMCGYNHDKLRALSAYETGLFGKLWNKLCIASPMAKAA
jgi:hypothetical protein